MASAEILSVGTELLLGQIIDTDAPTMARILAECGINCQRRTTIGDNFQRLQSAIEEALTRSDIVITIGGLGPTGDDLTRDAIAAALGDSLLESEEARQQLIQFFQSRGIEMVESNLRQAQRPESAQFVPNPNGTAPGLICEKHGKVVIALPGPPGEFNPMASGPVRDYLSTLYEKGSDRAGQSIIHSRTLRLIGIGESSAEARIKHLMDSQNPTLAPYAKVGEVHIRLSAKAESIEEANRIIQPVEQEVRKLLGPAVYGVDEETLAYAVVQLLLKRGQTVATSESITGGKIGEALTSVPGSSGAYVGGFVVYNPSAKRDLLGIEQDLIDQYGPVSKSVAMAMAANCRIKLNTDFAIAATGNAGPTADVDGKPVGLVYIGIADQSGVRVFEHQFRGIREDIRARVVQSALAAMRELLL